MFSPDHKSSHRRMYGYASSQGANLDLMSAIAASAVEGPWLRAFEVLAFTKCPEPEGKCSCVGCLITQEEIEYFNAGARGGFKYIAERHGLKPTEMWKVVEDGLRKLNIHPDDLEDLQKYCFGWLDLTPEAMHRWSLRYPKRCPLLDVLCSLDHTHETLNEVQDWLLDRKNSYGRTRNDVLPVLPDPDGIRPITVPLTPLSKLK